MLGFYVVVRGWERDRYGRKADACDLVLEAGNIPALAFPTARGVAGLPGFSRKAALTATAIPRSPNIWADCRPATIFKLLVDRGFETLSQGQGARFANRQTGRSWSLDLDSIARKPAEGELSARYVDFLSPLRVTFSPGVVW
jgi:hypothetical protein